jgi:hypothetical protein
MILTFIDNSARAVISFCIRSEILRYMVVPPDYTVTLACRFCRWIWKAYHDDVTIEILTDIDVTLHDRVEGCDVDTTAFKTQDRGLEQRFWGTESLVTVGDDLPIRKLVGLLQAGRLAGSLDLLLEVKGDVAELLLNVADDFSLGSGGEGVTALSQDLHEVVGQIPSSHVDTGNGVRKGETFVNRDNVGNSITRIKNDTSSTTGSIEGEDGLDRHVEGGGLEGFENGWEPQ